MFSNQVCIDCGQIGDERLLSDFCHDQKIKRQREYFSGLLPPKSVCSHCGENWSRKILGVWSYTNKVNDRHGCVRIRNEVRRGETLSETKQCHNMILYQPVIKSLNCLNVSNAEM